MPGSWTLQYGQHRVYELALRVSPNSEGNEETNKKSSLPSKENYKHSQCKHQLLVLFESEIKFTCEPAISQFQKLFSANDNYIQQKSSIPILLSNSFAFIVMSSSKARRGDSHERQSMLPTSAKSVPVRTRERKRNRKCISCLRCHRLKVRCDRKSPCTRCTTSRRPTKCIYENTSETQNETEARRSLEHGEGEEDAVTHGQRRTLFEESLDWSVPLDQVEGLSTGSGFQFRTLGLSDSPYSEPLERHALQNINHLQTPSQRERFSYDPTNGMLEQYRVNYLDPFEQTNQFVGSFFPPHSELADFWAGRVYTELPSLTQTSNISEGGE